MLVRQATTYDVEGFVAVVAAVADEGRWIATEPPLDVEKFQAKVRKSLADGVPLFVLDTGGQIVGTAGLHPTHVNGVVALGMSIIAQWRGRGGGRLLMAALIDHARGMGCHKIELEVWPDNARAIALYEKFGFEREGYRKGHYRRDDEYVDAILMAYRLR